MEESVQPALLELAETGLSAASRDFIAGGLAGMFGVAAGAPLDIIRVRQQQPGRAASSALQVLRSIVALEGSRSLFKGMAYPLWTSAVQNAVTFQSFGAAVRYTASDTSCAAAALPYGQIFVAGSFAGAVQTLVVTPVELLKIRLQLQTTVPGAAGYRGPLAMLRHVVRAEGLTGLYRGTVITGIRDIPSYGVYYTAFEACRELLDPGSRESKNSSPLTLWAAGGLAGAISWCSVYLFDLVKSRIQATSAAASPYSGWLDCAWQSYRKEGAGVFFRGLGATLSRAFVVNGAIFTTYELSHQALLSLGTQHAQRAAEPPAAPGGGALQGGAEAGKPSQPSGAPAAGAAAASVSTES